MENITVRVKQVNDEFNFTLFDLYEIKLTLISGNKFWIEIAKTKHLLKKIKKFLNILIILKELRMFLQFLYL